MEYKAMISDKELGDAIREAIILKGVTKKSVADYFGVKPPSVQDWIARGTISKEKLPALWEYFSDVVGPEHWGLSSFPSLPNKNHNVEEGPSSQGLVPLISSVQAGEWCEIMDTFQVGDAENWLKCPVKHGPNSFCLRVKGDSMKNPGSKPSYDPGDLIYVDPSKSPTSGDRVVVRLENEQEATFKQYIEEDGRKMLKALNPEWQPRYIEINGEATICGVVIGKWVPE